MFISESELRSSHRCPLSTSMTPQLLAGGGGLRHAAAAVALAAGAAAPPAASPVRAASPSALLPEGREAVRTPACPFRSL